MVNEEQGTIIKYPQEITTGIQAAMDARRDKFYMEMKKAVDEWLEENKYGEFGFHSERNIIASIDRWGDE